MNLQVHLERRPCADDVNEESLGRLAFQTQQFVGASLANLVNIAALNAGGAGRDSICYADLEQAGSLSPPSPSLWGPRLWTAPLPTLLPPMHCNGTEQVKHEVSVALEPVSLVSMSP